MNELESREILQLPQAAHLDQLFIAAQRPGGPIERLPVDELPSLAEIAEANTFVQDVPKAVERTKSEKAQERYSVEDVALDETAVEPVRSRLQTAVNGIVSRGSGRSLAMSLSYEVSAGAEWPDPNASDPNPSALQISQSDLMISGEGTGGLSVNMPDKGIFHFRNEVVAQRPRNIVLRDFAKLSQPASNWPTYGGLTDDYFAVRFEAAENCRVENLNFDRAEIALTFQFKQSSSANYSKANTLNAATAVDPATDQITVVAHDIINGEPVQLRKSGVAAVPAGLVIGQKYYAIVVDANTVKLASSKANASDGIAVDITAVGSGQLTLTNFRRGSFRNISRNCTAKNVRFMFMQLFGEQGGIHVGHSATGLANDGVSRGSAHGLRLIGYPFAPCENNRVEGHTYSYFSNGLSVQQYVRSNVVSITAEDCQNGISINRAGDTTLAMGDYTAAEGTPKGNLFTLIARDCDVGVYDDGGSYNTHIVNIAAAKQRGIFLSSPLGIAGLSIGNKFIGTIRCDGSRAVEINGPNTSIDLDIVGGGVGITEYGLLCSADRLTGAVRVSECTNAVRLSGHNGRLNVTVSGGSTDALVLVGNNNVIACNIDGNVTITGSGNTLTGRVSGTISNTGTGNDLSGILGRKIGGRLTSRSTNANGDMTITHGLNIPNRIVSAYIVNANYRVNVGTAGNSSFSLRVVDNAGAPVVNTSGLIIDYGVEAI